MNALEQVQAMYDRIEQRLREEKRKQGRKEGRKQGRREGEARALLLMCEERFGALPAAVTARVTRASTKRIERWLGRVLRVATLDEVFAD